VKIPWHTSAIDVLEQEFQTHLERGLTAGEATRRLAIHGPNALPEPPPLSSITLLLGQFSSLIIWILIGAALVSGLLQEWIDAAAILGIVILNALLGFVQEFKAERSLTALKTLSVGGARVIRDGTLCAIPAPALVPGDVIQIEAGDRVPADARLIYASGLQTQEASLTGESSAVAKNAEPISEPELSLGDRRNLLFAGTTVVSGKGRAIVVATGTATELGHIAVLLETATRVDRAATPLQRRLERLSHTLLWLSLGIVSVVFLLGMLRGIPVVAMFLTAVSLAVAAIPEGLPAVVTITLALGITKMVKRHAIIRRLPAVETLGSAAVICSDKTGTLTKNEMTVTALYQGGTGLVVTGEGYAPFGDFHWPSGRPKEHTLGLQALLQTAVLCNGAELRCTGDSWAIAGDPTEGALLVAAAKAGLWKQQLEHDNPFLGEVPFDPERKMMTIVRRTAAGPAAFVKGAPDELLQHCTAWMRMDGTTEPLTEEVRRMLLGENQKLAAQALRVLGVAIRRLHEDPKAYVATGLEHDLTFVGLAGMKDPIRPEVAEAMAVCRAAGIRTVMITGDHLHTAVAIAQELGLLTGDRRAISGMELDRLTDAELAAQVEDLAVYSRVSATHKLRVVKAWKAHGTIVAMTGDGVNDAPAVKEADIGIAMGVTGTDVTKEASDMVITDDNFASIAAAVEEGRAIFDNIRKAIHFLLSCNISEILIMLLATLFALPLPLLPVQILWINLMTDGLPALALAVDPKEPDLMRRPPRPPEEPLLTTPRIVLMFCQGVFLALIAMATFVFCLYGMDLELERARTVTFTIVVLSQLVHSINCRNDRRSLWAIGFWTNKPLLLAVGLSALLQAAIVLAPPVHSIFKVVSIDPQDWVLALSVGLLPLAAMEMWKAVHARLVMGPLRE
jgi:Ca2+-transporting ATPase